MTITVSHAVAGLLLAAASVAATGQTTGTLPADGAALGVPPAATLSPCVGGDCVIDSYDGAPVAGKLPATISECDRLAIDYRKLNRWEGDPVGSYDAFYRYYENRYRMQNILYDKMVSLHCVGVQAPRRRLR